VAVNDKTRPVPHEHLLPPLLHRLEALGIPPERITLVIATGTHPVMPPEEYPRILPPEIIERYNIVCHDAEDESALLHLGTTERGTPVYINRHYMEADLHLVIGNVEPHQFMGFSGGVKSAAIGVAGKATINHNHGMMTQAGAHLGHYDDNPARQDVEEIGRMLRVDFALNALLNGRKQIVAVLAGDPAAVMRAAIPRVRELYQIPVAEPFDLMIAAPGGHPKDINLYQAQKGLTHAALATRPGSTVILAAACPEGTGSSSYEAWIHQAGVDSHQAVLDRFAAEGFRVGPHKAFQLAREAVRCEVRLVSEMDADFVRSLLLDPAPSLQAALDEITLRPGARVGVMPVANATIPILESD
jgi:nickel-dependent lactate racemase